jgi:hypothetical protein
MATNLTPAKSGVLLSSKAPNLPIAPVEYTQQYQDQVLNALRLYFNQIDNFTQAASIPLSGTTANRPISTVQIPLPVGQQFFDTTLTRPIWWTGSKWIKADGTVV